MFVKMVKNENDWAQWTVVSSPRQELQGRPDLPASTSKILDLPSFKSKQENQGSPAI